MTKMKITVGLGSIDDFPEVALAGADEVYAGVIPMQWMEEAGAYRAINRREVLYSNVQIGSLSELRILKTMQSKYPLPISIALNSPYYERSLYPALKKAIRCFIEEGFDRFIIADLDFVNELSKDPALMSTIQLQISGEIGQINPWVLRQISLWKAKRVIFHRQTPIEAMKAMIDGGDTASLAALPEKAGLTGAIAKPEEYEAFLLNERCEFCGGYCRTLHVDEMPPMCRVPYRLSTVYEPVLAEETEAEHSLLGKSGCGLCALWKLRQAGITHLKIVSRGNYAEDTLRDLCAVVRARSILEESGSETEYVRQMKQELFPKGCGKNCYYLY